MLIAKSEVQDMHHDISINENFQISQDIDRIEAGNVKTRHTDSLLRRKIYSLKSNTAS